MIFSDFHDLRVDKEWLIDELSDDGGKLNLSTNLFHRKLSNETCMLYLYLKKGQNLGYFQILTRTKHRSPVGTFQLIYNPIRIHTYI